MVKLYGNILINKDRQTGPTNPGGLVGFILSKPWILAGNLVIGITIAAENIVIFGGKNYLGWLKYKQKHNK